MTNGAELLKAARDLVAKEVEHRSDRSTLLDQMAWVDGIVRKNPGVFMWIQLISELLQRSDDPDVTEVLTALHVAIAQSLRSA